MNGFLHHQRHGTSEHHHRNLARILVIYWSKAGVGTLDQKAGALVLSTATVRRSAARGRRMGRRCLVVPAAVAAVVALVVALVVKRDICKA